MSICVSWVLIFGAHFFILLRPEVIQGSSIRTVFVLGMKDMWVSNVVYPSKLSEQKLQYIDNWHNRQASCFNIVRTCIWFCNSMTISNHKSAENFTEIVLLGKPSVLHVLTKLSALCMKSRYSLLCPILPPLFPILIITYTFLNSTPFYLCLGITSLYYGFPNTRL